MVQAADVAAAVSVNTFRTKPHLVSFPPFPAPPPSCWADLRVQLASGAPWYPFCPLSLLFSGGDISFALFFSAWQRGPADKR